MNRASLRSRFLRLSAAIAFSFRAIAAVAATSGAETVIAELLPEKLALAAEAGNDLSEDGHWKIERDAEGEAILACTGLPKGKSAAFRSPPLPVRPWHRYRIRLEWRGGLFYKMTVALEYRLADGNLFEYPVFPGRKGIAPVPNWSQASFEFIVPSDASESRLLILAECESDTPYRPALRSVRLTHLGAEPLGAEPTPNRSARKVTPEEIEKLGGGRGYLKGTGTRRHLWTQAGAGLVRAGVVRCSVWARGKGTMRLTAQLRSNIYGRFFDHASPSWTLDDQWREYCWELPLSFPRMDGFHVTFVADVQGEGIVELDEPKVQRWLSSRPGPRESIQ